MSEKEYYGGIRRKLYGCNRAPQVTQTGGEVMKKVLLASTLLAGMASTATAGNVVDVLASPAVGMTMGVDKTAEVVNGAPGALKPVLALSVVPAVILFGIGNFLNELGNLGN